MLIVNRTCIRMFFFVGAFLSLGLLAGALYSAETAVRLIPPGKRPISKPNIVIPADFSYPNRSLTLPQYRSDSGKPAAGWSGKYVETRRFASDQSAWIFFRQSDLEQLIIRETSGAGNSLRIWPEGATLVIEIFKGHALSRKNARPVEIGVMSKSNTDPKSGGKGYYVSSWSYGRFKSDGSSFITPDKVRECHQCHGIAFHLTGDLVFTQLP